VQKGRRRRISN